MFQRELSNPLEEESKVRNDKNKCVFVALGANEDKAPLKAVA
jgi:hypothetical protein